jgi:hypothetical protein
LLASVAAGRQPQPAAGINPFAAISWQAPAPATAPAAPAVPPAPATPAANLPPPPPAPPPLPFRYLGRYAAGGAALVFLAQGEHVVLAKAGDTLDGGWRVDSIAGTVIRFTYLPLNAQRSLATGDLP